MEVVYEDNHIIIVNKKSGEIVQGDKTGDRPLSDIVKDYIKDCVSGRGAPFGPTCVRTCGVCTHLEGTKSAEQDVCRGRGA